MAHEHRIRRRFLSAAKRGDLAAAQMLLLRGAKADATKWQRYRYGSGKTALMLAARKGYVAIAQLRAP
jgi:ankyrin repeat protein